MHTNVLLEFGLQKNQKKNLGQCSWISFFLLLKILKPAT